MKIIFLFLIFVYQAFAQQGNIKGKVTQDNIPVPFVNIIILDTGIGTSSDEDGNYILKNIPVDEYELRFSAVGYETKTLKVSVERNKTVEMNVNLTERAIDVGTVEVIGNAFQDPYDTRTSLIDLNPRDAKIIPGAAEDVLRTLQSLPGVLAPNDFSSQLVVRGSGPDQNLIIMDDVEIFNPYRLYGVISMFNPDAVSDINLITGGFPAKYGDRLSAVLDVTNREGNDKKYLTGSLNASIVDANLVLEGKNPFNLKGSWLLNSRRTYYDLIIEPFVKSAGLVEENTTLPNFYDVQTKLVIGPYSGHKFLFNGIYSRDGVNVISGKERNTPDSVGVYNISRNDVLGFAWHYTPNKNTFNKLITSWYNSSGTTDFESRILDPSLNRDAFKDVIPDTLSPYLLGFNMDATFGFTKYSVDDKFTYLWGKNVLDAGAGVDFMKTEIDFKFELDDELRAFFTSLPQFRAVLDNLKDVKNYNRYRFYIQNRFALSERFFLQPSLRYDYYNILDKSYLAPRISLSYAIDDLTSLRAMWGIYYQSPGYEKLRDQSTILDLSERYTDPLEAEKAIHYVLGIERWLNSEWSVRLEGYYKDFSDLIVQQRVTGSKYYAEPIPGRDPKYVSGWTNPVIIPADSLTQIPVNNSVGEAYGIEIFLSKKNISGFNRLSGWVSYALAFAERIERNELIPFRFDQRHTINVVLNYKINDWLSIGGRFQYGSGFPYSEPTGVSPRIILADRDLDGVPETPVFATRKLPDVPEDQQEIIYDVAFNGDRLNSRRPAYHRLDIRLTALADYWGLDWAFYLDVINVYNRSNVIGYDYFVNEDLTLGRKATTMFPIIPTLGFSVRF
jgi:hypothetical protein